MADKYFGLMEHFLQRSKGEPYMSNEKTTTNTIQYTQQSLTVCRHSPTLVEEVQGVKLYGASGIRMLNCVIPKNMVLLNLSGTNYIKSYTEMIGPPDYVDVLVNHLPEPLSIIDLEWADGEAPCVLPTFWEVLHELLKKDESGKDGATMGLLVYCVGGHGRTGTALAAYMIANQKYPVSKAVNIVRDMLCTECIETQDQVEYLQILASHYGVEAEIITPKDQVSDPFYYSSHFVPEWCNEDNTPGATDAQELDNEKSKDLDPDNSAHSAGWYARYSK